MALDIIFLSYDEPCADEHFNLLKAERPYAKRVHGVTGIREAHTEAAKKSQTSNFFVVDADAEVIRFETFDYRPEQWDKMYVHIWNSLNAVTGDVYGYGGIKLLHKDMFKNLSSDPYVDFTTSLGNGVKIMDSPIYVSMTKVDTSPFVTWRSAFRESAKLAVKVKMNKDNDALRRFHSWLHSKACDKALQDFSSTGALEGWKFVFAQEVPDITCINNMQWLKDRYNELST